MIRTFVPETFVTVHFPANFICISNLTCKFCSGQHNYIYDCSTESIVREAIYITPISLWVSVEQY